MAQTTKNGMRDVAESTFTGFRVDPRIIQVEAKHNVRNFDLQENIEHIESLAASIAATGVQNPLVVRFDKGKVILVDGECRLRATMKAIKAGNDIKSVPVIQEDKRINEEGRAVELITRNTGKPLNYLERGEVFSRLKAFGWTDAQIAQKTGITGAHVSNILTLHSAPMALKKMVNEGKVAPTLAVEMVRKHGDEAPKVLKEHLTSAADNGKTKVTAKDVAKKKDKGENPYSFNQTEAKQMLAGLAHIYFDASVQRGQALTIIRNIFEDVFGSDWKAIAKAYHDEVNAA